LFLRVAAPGRMATPGGMAAPGFSMVVGSLLNGVGEYWYNS
jgi:hypothetical protein